MKTAADNNIPYKVYLDEYELPKAWYNVRADMENKPAPLLNPGTMQPMTAEELSAVFCDELIAQELDNENRYIPIPDEIRDFYKMYRPSPLVRAYLRHCTGLLREEPGPERRHDRDRCRPVGHGPLHGLRISRPRLPGLHGQGLL